MAQRKNSPIEEPTPDEASPAGEVPVFAPAEEPAPNAVQPAGENTPDPNAAPPAGENTPDPNAAPPADDVPVFAPAEEPAPAAQPFTTTLPDWLQDNYRELVTDENRNDSFTKLASRSTGALAAWARHEAELAGEDITPTEATPTEGASTRGAEDQ